MEDALARAKIAAEKDIIAIDRFEDRTIFHQLHGRHNGAHCVLRPTNAGVGTKTGILMKCVSFSYFSSQ